MFDPRGWHSRGYLPHYDDGRAIQAITYRLADGLPADVIAKIEEQALDNDKRRIAIEHYLDAGFGSCALRQAANAEHVLEAWRHFDDVQYRLHAWVVMPNHVHVLIEPLGDFSISEIVGAWKSVTARHILATTASSDRSGENTSREVSNPSHAAGGGRAPRIGRPKRHVWQPDYFDRFIRNKQHYFKAVDYVHENPVKAGLVSRAEDWPWSSAQLWLQHPRPPPSGPRG